MKKQSFKKRIETRKNEIRLTTTEPKEMLGKFLAKDLRRHWSENFIDEDSGEIVPVERYETIARAGVLVEGDILSRIMFHMSAGDISEVEVSNQRREAINIPYSHLGLWKISADIKEKKHKFLLYATSIDLAMEIAKDYIELNYVGPFTINSAGQFNNCILLTDNMKKVNLDYDSNIDDVEEEPHYEKKFYQITVNIVTEEYSHQNTFIIHSKDVDSAMVIINDWITDSVQEWQKNNGRPITNDFKTAIESAVVIPVSRIIEREFSLEYTEREE